MKITFFTAIILFYTQSCIAAGWGDLDGRNQNGDLLTVHPVWEDGPVEKGMELVNDDGELFVVRSYKDGKRIQGNSITFKYQRCKFKNTPRDLKPIEFSCENSGVSPLSGTRYKVIRHPKSCAFDYRYICTKGCDNPIVPKIMFHRPDGCFE